MSYTFNFEFINNDNVSVTYQIGDSGGSFSPVVSQAISPGDSATPLPYTTESDGIIIKFIPSNGIVDVEALSVTDEEDNVSVTDIKIDQDDGNWALTLVKTDTLSDLSSKQDDALTATTSAVPSNFGDPSTATTVEISVPQ